MTLIAYLFLRLGHAKIMVRYMCKKSRFRLPFQKEHGKLVSTLFKLERQHLHHIYWSTGRQLSCKKSLLVLWDSLRLFVNTMSAVDKCFLPHRDNLMQPTHMQLSQKLKTFSGFFIAFSKSRLNFEYFQKDLDKCSLPHRDDLMEPIHMQWSQKLKTFSRFFSAFSKSRLNFEYFQKNNDARSLFISEATAWKKRGYIYV